MLIKVATLFLIAMVILVLIGKWRTPDRRPKVENAVKCPDCGVYLIGNGTHKCSVRK
jgi:hypothetical protein